MHKMLVVQPLHVEAMALLDARPDVEYTVLTDVSEENLLANIGDVEAITIRDAKLPASVVAAAERLVVISRHGVGYDNVPVDLCTQRGIPVTLVGAVNAVSVAEQTMMLILAAARAAIELDNAVRRGDFGARSRVLGVELKGRTLVLVGYGRIGREVGTRAAAFGMQICVVDPYLTAVDDGIELVGSLEAALPRADILSLHVPLTDETRNIIGARELALMPAGSILVNASRGGVVDEFALLDSVRSGHLHGAGLDTFAVEPVPADSPLLAEPRIVLSPHSAALTEQALIAMGVATVRNALAGLDANLDPELVVNPSTLAPRQGDPDREGHA
ncbi:MAG: hydroxyacid dehydrogenase [Ilumatobacteraceae bacterium]